ncbi:MAG: Gfo/Idh/MocA family oxidoreductase [Acidobacteria bacterium]|nr:Gfo/Idh/MocA family oxidoreductase [Acidobacteriota bacterium]MBI3656391.1 Gfo/Idh/MocA family oxidoreductase [Acidobacteriota bacterium]
MLNVGIVGCGVMGEARARALQKMPQARLLAVTDVCRDRSEKLAARFHCAATPDLREILFSAEVNCIIVSVPPHQHVEACLAALEAGKHVIVEKPLANSSSAAQKIVEAAQVRGLVLATGFNYRYYPALRKARELIAAGYIGTLDHVRSFGGHPGGDEFTHAWVHDPEVMGGGTLMDNGIHIVDLTRHFLGEVDEVVGFRTDRVWRFKGCEDNGFALLRRGDGVVATLHTSWTEWRGYRFHIEIYGTEGVLRVAYPPMRLHAYRRSLAGRKARGKLYLFPMFQLNERLWSPRYTLVDSLIREMIDFQRRLRRETVPAATGKDGLRAIQIVEAVYQSAAAGGTPVKLSPL